MSVPTPAHVENHSRPVMPNVCGANDTVVGARVVATQRYRLSRLTVREPLLVLVLRGVKLVHSSKGSLEVRAGHGLLLESQTCWDVVNDPLGQTHYEALALSFPHPLIQAFQLAHEPGEARPVDEAQVLAVDAELREALHRTLARTRGRAVSPVVMQHRAAEVLLQLRDLGYFFSHTPDLSWVDRIRRLVAQRPEADWSVRRLADLFHVSESTLRRRIADSQTTLASVVREVRLEVALGMLQTTRFAVGEVAHRCGWASHSRFTAAFLARWGVSPSVVSGRRTVAAQKLTGSG